MHQSSHFIVEEADSTCSESLDSPHAKVQRVIRHSVFVFAAQILALCCGVFANFFVAWMLGPAGRGSFYLLQLIASVGQVLLNCGFGPAAVYYSQRKKIYSDNNVRSTILWASLGFGILPLLAFGVGWPVVAHLFTGKLSTGLLWVALASVPGMVVSWNLSYLSLARGRIGSFNLLRSAPSPLFLLGVTIAWLTQHKTPIAVGVCWLASTSATAAIAPFVIKRIYENKVDGRRQHFFRDAIAFGFRSHVGAVTQYFQHRADAVLVSILCPLRDVGIYSLAVSVAELLWYLPNTVASVLISPVAESSEREGAILTAAFCRATLAITAILAVLLAMVAAWLIPVVLPAFSYSSWLLFLLLPGTVSVVLFKILSSDLNGRGRPLETFRPAIISLAASLLAGILLIPHYGISAAAMITSAGYILNSVLSMQVYSKITRFPIRQLLVCSRADLHLIRDAWRVKRAGASRVSTNDAAPFRPKY